MSPSAKIPAEASGRPIPLGEVAEIRMGIPTTAPKPGEEMGQPLVLTVRCLVDGEVDSNLAFPGIPAIGLSEKYKVRTGDVLLPARSTSLDAAVVPESLDGMYFNSSLLTIRCGPRMNPHLLRAFLLHSKGHEAILALAQSGTAQINVTVRALSELVIPVLPLDRQEAIARLLVSAERAHRFETEAARTRFRVAREIAVQSMLEKDSR